MLCGNAVTDRCYMASKFTNFDEWCLYSFRSTLGLRLGHIANWGERNITLFANLK